MSNFSIFRSSKHFPKQYMPKHSIIILQTIGGNGNIQKSIFPTIHTAIILRITLTEIIVIAKLPVSMTKLSFAPVLNSSLLE